MLQRRDAAHTAGQERPDAEVDEGVEHRDGVGAALGGPKPLA